MAVVRAARLVSLLLLLQARGRMSARELATELEVSVRTVHRDVEALAAAGIPVYAERGRTGGYRLLEGYRTRLTGLTAGEAESLFLAGMPGAAAELGLGAELTTAQLKLLAALPGSLGARASRIRERFHLDATAWFREPDPVPHLAAVADAVWHSRMVEVRYARRSGEVRRTLRPLGVVLKAGVWYLVAAADGGVRTYRVSRILDVVPMDRFFERPEGFDLAEYWRRSTSAYEELRYQGEAVLRLSPRGRELLPLQLGAEGARAVANAGPPDEEGWVRVVLRVEWEAVAVGDLLRLGAEAEVLGPPALRRRIASVVRTLAERYARDLGPGPAPGSTSPAAGP